MITYEMNEDLSKEVSEEEIRYTRHSFQKGKIPGPDGFTIDFYLGFYDLMKNDILEVVRESQESGKVLGSINSTFLSLIQKKIPKPLRISGLYHVAI